MIDFRFTNAIILFSEDDAARSQNFATVYATTNWLSMFVQLFLTSYVMRRFGLATALLVLPCTIALASIGFLFVPTLLLGSLLSVADNGSVIRSTSPRRRRSTSPRLLRKSIKRRHSLTCSSNALPKRWGWH
jgi:dipeptide/tripeptide permease